MQPPLVEITLQLWGNRSRKTVTVSTKLRFSHHKRLLNRTNLSYDYWFNLILSHCIPAARAKESFDIFKHEKINQPAHPGTLNRVFISYHLQSSGFADTLCEKEIFWSACTHVHANLSLPCSTMTSGSFSHGAVHIRL